MLSLKKGKHGDWEKVLKKIYCCIYWLNFNMLKGEKKQIKKCMFWFKAKGKVKA